MSGIPNATNEQCIGLVYNDLRLADNPALVNAIESGKPVIPIFIWDENDSDLHTGGAAKVVVTSIS